MRTAPDYDSLQRAYSRHTHLIASHFEDILNDPKSYGPLISQEWSVVNRLLASRVAGSPPADAQAYKTILSALSPAPQTFVADLGGRATLIAFNPEYSIGHVVVAYRRPGGKPKFWQIDEPTPSGIQPQSSYVEGQLSCWKIPSVAPCYTRDAGVLPSDRSGAQRFYIEAGYAQVAGATAGYQLSIWRWDGRRATPLYVTSFAGMEGAPQEGVHVDGDTIRIAQKDQTQWKILDPCGGCDGRQTVHLLRLNSEGFLDEGTVSLTPELDLVDEIYRRFRAGQSAEALASPSVLQFMRQLWVSNEMDQRDVGFLKMLFMNVPETAAQKGDGTQLCFRAYYGIRSESMTATLFTFAGKGRELRIVDAQQNAAGC